MSPDAIAERVAQVTNVASDSTARSSSIRSALVSAREIESWVHAQVAGLVGQLSEVEHCPEATIAEASKGSLVTAAETMRRAATLAETPAFAAALADGVVTIGHVDAVTAGAQQLGPEQRNGLFARVEEFVSIAATDTIDQFTRRIGTQVTRLSADDAGRRDVAHMHNRARHHLKVS